MNIFEKFVKLIPALPVGKTKCIHLKFNFKQIYKITGTITSDTKDAIMSFEETAIITPDVVPTIPLSAINFFKSWKNCVLLINEVDIYYIYIENYFV
jgi:hypothetical protein